VKRKVQVIIQFTVMPIKFQDGKTILSWHFLPTKAPTLPEESHQDIKRNIFLGEDVQKTADIRKGDEKGRHTTTVRQLFLLPNRTVLIDNPGIREIQPGDSSDGLEKTFSEIVNAARDCRFKDCTHRDEPGCAEGG
jgi:hypothetical protein